MLGIYLRRENFFAQIKILNANRTKSRSYSWQLVYVVIEKEFAQFFASIVVIFFKKFEFFKEFVEYTFVAVTLAAPFWIEF